MLSLALLTGEASHAAGPVEFNRDIRALLSDRCFACHGPDKNTREANLRLDTEEGLFRQGDSGKNIVPGKPADSVLVHRITSTDPAEKMPPPDSGKELSAAEVQLIKTWIEQGAKWEGHWAYQPIRRPAIPAGSDPQVVNPLDRFIRQSLQQQGLAPSAEADRRTLIRRLSFDLIGLPPTAAEVEQFVADGSEQAYEKLVNRLLESPHFGERQAMWWLDLVRYADSVGYHGDQPVTIYPYREYVIQSFNQNKPFDQFTIEQLAGDLLPNATLEQKIASGYNRMGMMSAEGGVQPKEYLAKYIAERVRNIGGAWLGVTMNCCECHDHKYDPFTMRDFYGMEAFFADIEERGLYSGGDSWGPQIKVPTSQQAAQLAEFDSKIAQLRQKLDTPTAELAAAQSAWEKQQIVWQVLKPTTATAASETTLQVKPDQSILASGKSPPTEVYTITINDPPPGITGLRLEVLPDDSLPRKGPGRASNGNFVVTEFTAQFRSAGLDEIKPVALQNPTATYEQTGAAEKNPFKKWAVAAAIDGDTQGAGWGWAVMEQVGQAHSAVFETAENIAGGPGSALIITIAQRHENPQHTLGKFRLSVTTAARPLKAGSALPPPISAVLNLAADQRTEANQRELAAHYRSIAPALDATRTELKQAEAGRVELEKRIPTTLVTVSVKPRTVRVLPRGNWMDDTGEEMTPRFPGVLASAGKDDRRLNRLDLAQWLISPQNPLTARTLANRLWKLYFGAGLSRKLDDLGSQGDWPTHPELLDWMAGQLIDTGWDLKQMIRLIVTSRTYRQTAADSPELREKDPFNKWLARQSRFRLDAEIVRDNALEVSGLLVKKLGGPSVKPYQPPGYWAYLNFPSREWQNGSGEELYRRGLYTHWQRQYLHPSMLAFDAPSREECAADRSRSNTPLQSLVLLNDPTYVEAARVLAERALQDGGAEPATRLDWLFRRVLSRPATPAESKLLLSVFEKHLQEYQQEPKSADELATVGAHPVPANVNKVQLAAWTSITRAILSLHETITRN
ncbi:MAG: PSD1 and planctomycete cytochrome C domain-containing protein [Planctomycetota bacterium]